MTSKVVYSDNLRTELVHIKSNSQIINDAPVDNHGKGMAFSPTDLLATSLASCMLTVVGIKAQSLKIDIKGSEALVQKYMTNNPRRVDSIEINVTFRGLLDIKTRKVFENIALNCPVALSLNPNISQKISFSYTN
ncbi:MAG: OsmC family protein [Bacteroidia bacterium]